MKIILFILAVISALTITHWPLIFYDIIPIDSAVYFGISAIWYIIVGAIVPRVQDKLEQILE